MTTLLARIRAHLGETEPAAQIITAPCSCGARHGVAAGVSADEAAEARRRAEAEASACDRAEAWWESEV